MPPQHTKPLHSSDWMPTSTKQMSKYGGLLPLETPKGILRPWLPCFLFRIRGTQKLGLKKTSGSCSVQHQTPDSIRYPYTAPDMRLSNLFFKTPPLMDFHHSFMWSISRDDLGHAKQLGQGTEKVNTGVTLLSRLRREEIQTEVRRRMGKLRGAAKNLQDFDLCLLQTSKNYTKPNPPLITSGGPEGFQMVYKWRVRAMSALHEVTITTGRRCMRAWL